MPFVAADFAEDTDLERLVLERLGTYRVRTEEPGAIHDHRGSGSGTTVIKVGTAVVGTSLRDDLRNALKPLGFGAAYKVLDMLVEHVLRANGATGRLRFDQKERSIAVRPAALPPPMDTKPELWDRLAVLYVAFQEARHAVTHRRASATPSGELEIYDDGRHLVDTLSEEEIQSFAAAVHAAAELIIGGSTDNRSANIVAWHLNVLRTRHGRPSLTAANPDAHRRLLVMDLQETPTGELIFDIEKARRIVGGQTPSYWDVRLHSTDQVFVGAWEEMPSKTGLEIRFHPSAPPLWLQEAVL
jgi:hypothetical protein